MLFSCMCSHIEDDILNATWDNSKSYIPHVTGGKVIKVYDGDTITIATKLKGDECLYRFSVRLNGIDTPELKTKNTHEKEHAIVARDALHDKIFDKMVELKNVSMEKYGRLLADVYFEGVCLNSWMIDNNYAVAYDGNTKQKPDEWFV